MRHKSSHAPTSGAASSHPRDIRFLGPILLHNSTSVLQLCYQTRCKTKNENPEFQSLYRCLWLLASWYHTQYPPDCANVDVYYPHMSIKNFQSKERCTDEYHIVSRTLLDCSQGVTQPTTAGVATPREPALVSISWFLLRQVSFSLLSTRTLWSMDGD